MLPLHHRAISSYEESFILFKSMLCMSRDYFFIFSVLFSGFSPKHHAVQQFYSEQVCSELSLDQHRNIPGVQIEIDQMALRVLTAGSTLHS